MKYKNYKDFSQYVLWGFTLVELIVTVTILAVLATIWFVSYSAYIINSRDSSRISELTRISNGLLASKIIEPLPFPESSVNITHEGNVLSIQWYLWNNVFEAIGYTEFALDPKDDTPFLYSIDAARDSFQLLAYMENIRSGSNTFWEVNRFPKTFGSRLGAIIDSTTSLIDA